MTLVRQLTALHDAPIIPLEINLRNLRNLWLLLMKESVGFIGLGIMGGAMATNLLKASFDLTVWNRTPGRMTPLA